MLEEQTQCGGREGQGNKVRQEDQLGNSWANLGVTVAWTMVLAVEREKMSYFIYIEEVKSIRLLYFKKMCFSTFWVPYSNKGS